MIRITTGSQALDELLGGNFVFLVGQWQSMLVMWYSYFLCNQRCFCDWFWKGGIETLAITEAFGEFRWETRISTYNCCFDSSIPIYHKHTCITSLLTVSILLQIWENTACSYSLRLYSGFSLAQLICACHCNMIEKLDVSSRIEWYPEHERAYMEEILRKLAYYPIQLKKKKKKKDHWFTKIVDLA